MVRPCLPPPPPARDTVPCEAPPESGEVSVIPARVSAGMLAAWRDAEANDALDTYTAHDHAAAYPGSLYQ